jgi:hypothetical protein
MNSRLFLIVLFVTGFLAVMGQSRSIYNLNHVRVELMDGRIINGKWITASNDTLVLQVAGVAAKGPVSGSEVNFRLKGAGREYAGTLEEVTETTIRVRLFDQPDTTFLVSRRYVTYMEVTRAAVDHQRKKPRIHLSAQQIRSIRVHRKGSGSVGFFVGFLTGSFISFKFSSGPFGESTNGPGVLLPFFLAPVIGVAVATQGKRHPIDGNAGKFNEFVQKVIKR